MRGVVAASSGNHAQAVALAAQLHGLPATIVMPHDAPAVKRARRRSRSARRSSTTTATPRTARRCWASYAAERGLEPVHPFEDPRVMAGQGTAALELLDRRAGHRRAGRAGRRRRPDLRLRDGRRGGRRAGGRRRARGGRRHPALAGGGRARARSTSRGRSPTGSSRPPRACNTFPIVQRLVSEIVTVTDDEIRRRDGGSRATSSASRSSPAAPPALAALLQGRVMGHARPGVDPHRRQRRPERRVVIGAHRRARSRPS